MSSGYLFYRGASRLDGRPIVGIVTLKTKNAKTGNMLQTWILRDRISPIAALANGGDFSICGNCPFRGTHERDPDGVWHNRGNGCYVEVGQAPQAIWNKFRRNQYPIFQPADHAGRIAGRALRLGSYGDPTAIPLAAWRPLLQLTTGRTGYTHQWRQPRFRHWSQYLMASTHSLTENEQARALGWRSFRARRPGDALAPDEIVCPASAEGGNRLDCAHCLACSGGSPARRSVAIIAHGGPATLASALRILDPS